MQMRDITELSLGIFLDREIRHYLRDILKVYRFISASVAMRPARAFRDEEMSLSEPPAGSIISRRKLSLFLL